MNALELFALKTGKYGRVAQTIKNMRITKNLNRGFPRESLCSLISLRLLQVAHYKDLMKRMKNAHEKTFYLESCWFAYTVLEDRLLSALRQSGGPCYANHKPIRMLGKKMQEIGQRKQNDQLLVAYFDDDLMGRIHQWKEDRNDLTHAMADGTKPMSEIDKAAYLLSINAKTLVKDVCAAARRLKKNREKA